MTNLNKDHLDNDKELDNILANLAWNGKYTDSGQEIVDKGAVEKAKDLIDQYTQSKLKAFAGEFEKAIGEDEADILVKDNGDGSRIVQVSPTNEYRAELRESLKAIKEKAGIE